jgi:hypothetical protein
MQDEKRKKNAEAEMQMDKVSHSEAAPPGKTIFPQYSFALELPLGAGIRILYCIKLHPAPKRGRRQEEEGEKFQLGRN